MLSTLGLNKYIDLRGSNLTTEDGIENFHHTKGRHWVAHIIETYFVS